MAVYSDEQRQSVENWFARKQTDTQSKGLSAKLSRKLNISKLYIDQIIKDLLREGTKLTSRNGHYNGKLTCHLPAPVDKSEHQWLQVLKQSPVFEVLAPFHSAIADWETTDMERLLQALISLRDALPDAYQLSTFEASARYLLGSAKLLNNLDKKSLKLFGIDVDKFQPTTTYVVIAGPEQPEQVLLIENPQSFEACIRAGLHNHQTLICTYGYGLQWNQVLAMPEYVTGLIRAGQTDRSLLSLLSHKNIYFWGDLDHEGLKIFQSISTNRIPHCKLSNLYLPMIEALKNGQCHPYTKVVEKEKQTPRSGLPDLSFAVDQEYISDPVTLISFSSGGMTLSELTALLLNAAS